MTSFNPNLRVDRLSVRRGKHEVYSEAFHPGLNIISGENSSGKSSIMDFLFFGLGGDLTEHQWRETSLLCDKIYLGVQLNGTQVTLSRDVEPKTMRPMEIFYGSHDEALRAPAGEWQKYPYSRGATKKAKESFSQVMFRLLGLPEVRIEEQNVKITMHQLLRILYSDQLTSVERIFRVQQPDDATTRSTVGDILLGAYSDKFYSATLRLREAVDELKDVKAKERSVGQGNQIDGRPITELWLVSESSKLTGEIEGIASDILKLEEDIFSEQFQDRLTLNDQEETYAQVVALQGKIGKLDEALNSIELEISDAQDFIAAMERKIGEITCAGTVVEEFGYLAFDICPACMGLVSSHDVAGACSLCKTPFDKRDTISRSAKMLNEAIRQRDRSSHIQRERLSRRDDLIGQLEVTKRLWEDASRYYTIALRTPSTKLRSQLRELNRESGYKYRQLEELASKKAVIEELRLLAKRRQSLEDEMEDLRATIEFESKRNVERRSQARALIENVVLDFLRHDLDRQSTFKLADKVDFDFDGDRLSVNDESFFSASSMVYLRNSFLAAFHFAAVGDPGFGHPRFMLMDTIEDKGMEQERSMNFQKLLAQKSKEAPSAHQLIIATSMIAEELNNSQYVVGKHYSHKNRTLNILTR